MVVVVVVVLWRIVTMMMVVLLTYKAVGVKPWRDVSGQSDVHCLRHRVAPC